MRFSSLVAVGALLSASFAARADSVQYSLSINGQATQNGSGDYGVATNFFPQFNPAIGSLNSIAVVLAGSATTPQDGDLLFALTPASNPQEDALILLQFEALAGTYPFSINGSLPSYVFSYFEGTGTQGLNLNFINQDTVSAAGSVTYNYTPNTVAATPEPSSIALLGSGLLGVAGVVRKRFS